MLKYFLKRILMAFFTLIIITAFTFFAMNAVPGGPFDQEKALSSEVKEALQERFGLDKPLGERFLLYLSNILRGDFGVSLKTGRDVSDTISESFRVSAKLGGMAMLAAVVFGIALGCLAACLRDGWQDRTILFITTLFISVPSFVVASLLILLFCLTLQWFPVWSAEQGSFFRPGLALCLYPMSCIIRFTRTSMLDVLGQDYIRTARAQGLSEANVIFRLALRNAAIPVITYVGPMAAYTLTGSIVVETVFTIGGLGSKFVLAIANRDYTMIMGTTIFLALVIVTITLLSDLLYKLVDPRIKFS